MPLLYGGKVFWVFWWFILSPLSGATITSPPYAKCLNHYSTIFLFVKPSLRAKLTFNNF